MTLFYFCAFILDGKVIMVGADPLNSPFVPTLDPKPDLVIVGTALGPSVDASVLYPLASWDGKTVSIEGATILSHKTVKP